VTDGARTEAMRARPRIVIVGAGFGGLAAAHGLRRAPADVTVIDRRNYHLFQPLLYQVATAALAPSDIAWPIRRLLRHQENVRVCMAEVTDIDTRARCVRFAGGGEHAPALRVEVGAFSGGEGHGGAVEQHVAERAVGQPDTAERCDGRTGEAGRAVGGPYLL